MRKIIICCLLFLSFTSCFNYYIMGDWSIKLINNYEIWRSSSDNIIIGLVKDNGISYKGGVTEGELAIIPAKIIKYSIYNQYICAIVDPYIFGKIDHTELYYILNTTEQKITLPMSEDEYNIQIQYLGIIIDEWVETKNINAEWLKNNGYIRINNKYDNKWEKL